MTRTDEISEFLSSTGFSIIRSEIVAGDASNRRYERVFLAEGRTLILMDAPPEKGENTEPFIRIAELLTNAGLSAPNILARNVERGLLLIEDFGDFLFDRHVIENPVVELEIYSAAWGALEQISKMPVPENIPPYDAVDMANKAGLVAQWYDPNLDEAAVVTQMNAALNELDWSHVVLVLRDFHAQNLIWLPDRIGAKRVGLLDFQDAQPGHILYDLVSLIYDARRDVSPPVQNAMLDMARKDTRLADFDAAIATLLAQRSLRIIGVFARLWLRDGKAGYLQLLPRVFGHLDTALAHPSLSGLCNVLCGINRPTPETLKQIQARR